MKPKDWYAKTLASKDQAWSAIESHGKQIMEIGIHGIRNDDDAKLCKRICCLLFADSLMKHAEEEME